MEDPDYIDEAEPIRIPVTDVLDLHNIPPRDAKPVVEEYLREARRLGFSALRIIHGRGIGVQREMVRTVLARTSFVAGYGDAPAGAGVGARHWLHLRCDGRFRLMPRSF